jgi:hypothetical protein
MAVSPGSELARESGAEKEKQDALVLREGCRAGRAGASNLSCMCSVKCFSSFFSYIETYRNFLSVVSSSLRPKALPNASHLLQAVVSGNLLQFCGSHRRSTPPCHRATSIFKIHFQQE